MMIAGWLCSSSAASVPTGGLSQATTAIVPARPGRAQVLAKRIVGHLAPDERVAHLARAVADAIRRRDRVFGLNEPQLELARSLADAALEARMDRIDLCHHAHVALAVALGADHADRRLVYQIRIGPKLPGNSDGLG